MNSCHWNCASYFLPKAHYVFYIGDFNNERERFYLAEFTQNLPIELLHFGVQLDNLSEEIAKRGTFSINIELWIDMIAPSGSVPYYYNKISLPMEEDPPLFNCKEITVEDKWFRSYSLQRLFQAQIPPNIQDDFEYFICRVKADYNAKIYLNNPIPIFPEQELDYGPESFEKTFYIFKNDHENRVHILKPCEGDYCLFTIKEEYENGKKDFEALELKWANYRNSRNYLIEIENPLGERGLIEYSPPNPNEDVIRYLIYHWMDLPSPMPDPRYILDNMKCGFYKFRVKAADFGVKGDWSEWRKFYIGFVHKLVTRQGTYQGQSDIIYSKMDWRYNKDRSCEKLKEFSIPIPYQWYVCDKFQYAWFYITIESDVALNNFRYGATVPENRWHIVNLPSVPNVEGREDKSHWLEFDILDGLVVNRIVFSYYIARRTPYEVCNEFEVNDILKFSEQDRTNQKRLIPWDHTKNIPDRSQYDERLREFLLPADFIPANLPDDLLSYRDLGIYFAKDDQSYTTPEELEILEIARNAVTHEIIKLKPQEINHYQFLKTLQNLAYYYKHPIRGFCDCPYPYPPDITPPGIVYDDDSVLIAMSPKGCITHSFANFWPCSIYSYRIKRANCVMTAKLFVSMCRAAGIPAVGQGIVVHENIAYWLPFPDRNPPYTQSDGLWIISPSYDPGSHWVDNNSTYQSLSPFQDIGVTQWMDSRNAFSYAHWVPRKSLVANIYMSSKFARNAMRVDKTRFIIAYTSDSTLGRLHHQLSYRANATEMMIELVPGRLYTYIERLPMHPGYQFRFCSYNPGGVYDLGDLPSWYPEKVDPIPINFNQKMNIQIPKFGLRWVIEPYNGANIGLDNRYVILKVHKWEVAIPGEKEVKR